jgi:hypothetical protein
MKPGQAVTGAAASPALSRFDSQNSFFPHPLFLWS